MLRLAYPFIEVGLVMRAPSEAVWELFVDTVRWVEWGPSVTSVDFRGRRITAGSTGRIRTVLGIWAPFRIADFEEGSRWSWLVWGLPATGHRLDPLGPESCRAIFEVPWWALLYVPVCLVALKRMAQILRRAKVGH